MFNMSATQWMQNDMERFLQNIDDEWECPGYTADIFVPASAIVNGDPKIFHRLLKVDIFVFTKFHMETNGSH